MGGVKWNLFRNAKQLADLQYLNLIKITLGIYQEHGKWGRPQLRWEDGVRWDMTISGKDEKWKSG